MLAGVRDAVSHSGLPIRSLSAWMSGWPRSITPRPCRAAIARLWQKSSTRHARGRAARYPGQQPGSLFQLLLLGWGEHHRGLGGQHPESERLLEVEPDRCFGVVEVADREILADIQFEIATPRC